MRNLKRALSVALAAVMLLGMMVIGAGAVSINDFADKDEIDNQEAVALLVDLGVLEGLDGPNGTTIFQPDATLQRQAMAKIAYMVATGATDWDLYATSSPKFTDLGGSWAKGAIEYCNLMGYITGYTSTIFGPEDTLTVAQTATVLLRVLGYDNAAQGYDTDAWMISAMRDAKANGLLDGVSNTNAGSPISRQDACQMAYNALFANTVTGVPQYDNGIKYITEYKQGDILGTQSYNLAEITGVVTANEVASLPATSGIVTAAKKAGETTIGGETYGISTGLNELGKTVTFYVQLKSTKRDDDGKLDLTASNVAKMISTDVVVGSANKVNTVSTTGTATIEAYTAKTYPKTTAPVYATLANSAVDTTKALASGATIDYIDNNNDGAIEYAIISNYTFTKVVNKTTANKGTIAVNNMAGAWTSENTVGFADVEKDDYVLATTFGGKLYLEKAEPFYGVLTGFNATRKTVTIDGKTYSYVTGANTNATGTADTTNLVAAANTNSYLNNTNRYFLNKAGAVIATIAGDGTAAGSTTYAVVLEYKYDESSLLGGTTGAKAYVVFPDGTAGAYNVVTDDDHDGVVDDQTTDLEDAAKDAPILVKYVLDDNGIVLAKVDDGDGVTATAFDAAAWKNQTQLTSDVNADKTFASSTKKAGIYLNANTQFLFIDKTTGAAQTFTGIANVRTMSAVADTMVVANKATGIASLVIVNAAPDAEVVIGSTVYCLSATAETTQAGSSYPFLSTTGEVLWLTLTAAPTAGKTYTYETNDKGISTVREAKSADGIIGTLDPNGSFAVIDGNVVSLADGVVAYAFSGNNIIGYTVTPTALAVNQQITYVTNNSGELAIAYVLVNDATACVLNSITYTNVTAAIGAVVDDEGTVTLDGSAKATFEPFEDGEIKAGVFSVSDGAEVSITNSSDQAKTSGALAAGDKIIVTAADGQTKATYTVAIAPDA